MLSFDSASIQPFGRDSCGTGFSLCPGGMHRLKPVPQEVGQVAPRMFDAAARHGLG